MTRRAPTHPARLRALLLAATLVVPHAGPVAWGDEPARGFLILRVHRPGTVWLNDTQIRDLSGRVERAPRAWDQTVAQSTELPPGTYRIRLKPADDRMLSPEDEVEFTVTPGETTDVVLGRPLLHSSPSGARVQLGDQDVGATPLRLDPERLGSRPVVLLRAGYEPWSVRGDSLLALARESGALRVELVPLAGGPALPEPEPRRYLGLRRTPALITSVAVVLTGVTAAALLKEEADEAYLEYLRTADIEEQEEAFARAERYDRLSLIGWGLAEAAFFAAFFILIQEEPRGLIPTATAARAPDGSPGMRLGVTHAF